MSLGYSHPDELKMVLTSRQITDWMAFYRLEPFGPPASFERTAMQVAATYNAAPFKRKGAKPLMPSDFMPESMKQPKKPLGRRILEAFRGLGAKEKGKE